MEDRQAPALYLELSSTDADRYARSRVPALLSGPSVRSASWWTNTGLGRRDLPRRMEDAALLGLYELDGGFKPPPPGAGTRGIHLRRTARPGQGSLTGRPTDGLLLVLISPRQPSGAEALRDWADFVHLRHIAESAVPGYAMITPYENVERQPPWFLHLYEMNSGDPERTFQTMRPLVEQRLGGGPGTARYDEWASHPELRIDFVSTFALLGRAVP